MTSAQKAAPRRLFHGWYVVGAAFVVLFLAYGMQFSYGVFVASMSHDLGWSRAETALPYSIYVFVYSALSAVTGHATDRFGPRRVIYCGALLLGLGWSLSAWVRHPWQLNLTLGLVAGLGMSVAWVPCNATVARWFTRRRGTAVAIASSGASLGNFIVPAGIAALIGSWGWRGTLSALAVVSALLMLLAARFMVRDPEEMGLWPDGDRLPPSHAALYGGYTVRELWRSESFLFVNAIYFLTWIVVFIPFVHAPAYAHDLGLSPLASASILSGIGIGGVVGRLSSGIVSDALGRFPTLLATFALQVAGFLLFAWAHGIASLWFAAVIFGLSYGGGVALLPPLCGDLFGRAHVASVVGTIFALAGSPAAIGPTLAGWLYDTSGSYRSTFMLAAGLNGLAFGLTAVFAWRQRHAIAFTP